MRRTMKTRDPGSGVEKRMMPRLAGPAVLTSVGRKLASASAVADEPFSGMTGKGIPSTGAA